MLVSRQGSRHQQADADQYVFRWAPVDPRQAPPQRTTLSEQPLDLLVKVLHGMAERLDLTGDRWPALQPWQFGDEDTGPMHVIDEKLLGHITGEGWK
jgi:hypothetical protein